MNNIILIGSSGAGKSTVAQLLGKHLNRPALELDDLRWGYFAEIGYDAIAGKRIQRTLGMMAVAEYWKPYDIYSVERMLVADYPAGHVIAFAVGQSVYKDAARTARVQAALGPHFVILLLPATDINIAVQIMEQRIIGKEPEAVNWIEGISEMNRYFLAHPANASLADVTVYTQGKTPQQTCDEIIECLQAIDG